MDSSGKMCSEERIFPLLQGERRDSVRAGKEKIKISVNFLLIFYEGLV